jgi:hypothetical protein
MVDDKLNGTVNWQLEQSEIWIDSSLNGYAVSDAFAKYPHGHWSRQLKNKCIRYYIKYNLMTRRRRRETLVMVYIGQNFSFDPINAESDDCQELYINIRQPRRSMLEQQCTYQSRLRLRIFTLFWPTLIFWKMAKHTCIRGNQGGPLWKNYTNRRLATMMADTHQRQWTLSAMSHN